MSDPAELRDLSKKKAKQTATWRKRLAQALEGREEGFVRDGELVVGRPQNPTLSEPGTYGER